MTIIYGRWDVISFHKNLAKPWPWLIWRRNAKSDHFLDKVYRSHLRPSSFFVRNAKDDHKVQLGIATKVVFVVLRNAKTTCEDDCTRSNDVTRSLGLQLTKEKEQTISHDFYPVICLINPSSQGLQNASRVRGTFSAQAL